MDWTVSLEPQGKHSLDTFQCSMCIYLPRLHICSSFPHRIISRFLDSSSVGNRRKGELLVESNSLIDYLCPHPFPKITLGYASMCCLHLRVITWSASVARSHQLTSSEYFVIGCLLEKRADIPFQLLFPLFQEKLLRGEIWLTRNQGKGWLCI